MELNPLSFHKLCTHIHVNKTKFERNSSLVRVLSDDLYWENQKSVLLKEAVLCLFIARVAEVFYVSFLLISVYLHTLSC